MVRRREHLLRICVSVYLRDNKITKNTRCAWAGGTCANFPDFFENHHFHVIYCVTLAFVLFSKNFRFTIHIVDS